MPIFFNDKVMLKLFVILFISTVSANKNKHMLYRSLRCFIYILLVALLNVVYECTINIL